MSVKKPHSPLLPILLASGLAYVAGCHALLKKDLETQMKSMEAVDGVREKAIERLKIRGVDVSSCEYRACEGEADVVQKCQEKGEKEYGGTIGALNVVYNVAHIPQKLCIVLSDARVGCAVLLSPKDSLRSIDTVFRSPTLLKWHAEQVACLNEIR